MNDPADGPVPVIVDLGKVKRKAAKRLKRGRGKLVDEIDQVIAEVKANLGEEAAGKELLPVIILYEKKRKKNKRRRVSLFPIFD